MGRKSQYLGDGQDLRISPSSSVPPLSLYSPLSGLVGSTTADSTHCGFDFVVDWTRNAWMQDPNCTKPFYVRDLSIRRASWNQSLVVNKGRLYYFAVSPSPFSHMTLVRIIESRKLDYLCYLGLLGLNEDKVFWVRISVKTHSVSDNRRSNSKWFKQCVN